MMSYHTINKLTGISDDYIERYAVDFGITSEEDKQQAKTIFQMGFLMGSLLSLRFPAFSLALDATVEMDEQLMEELVEKHQINEYAQLEKDV